MATIYTKSNHQVALASPLALKCFSEENIEIVFLILKTDESIPIHKNPFNVLFYVKSGKGIINVENQEYNLCENELVFVLSNENRSWKNIDKANLELIVVKMLK